MTTFRMNSADLFVDNEMVVCVHPHIGLEKGQRYRVIRVRHAAFLNRFDMLRVADPSGNEVGPADGFFAARFVPERYLS